MKNITRIILLVLVVLVSIFAFPPLRFVIGAGFINIGYYFQDAVLLSSEIEPSSRDLLSQILNRNKLSSSVRKLFPRTNHHPLVAVVSCMDGRLHTEELVGDTRGFYYNIRTAGSIIEPPEIEMLELAVSNGVKLIILTTHSDCAAEKVSKDQTRNVDFPNLSRAVNGREERFKELLQRPVIADKVKSGELLIHRLNIDTLAGGELELYFGD